MPRGRPIQIQIRLSPADAATLEAWHDSPTIRANQKRRGRLIQQLAQGWSVTAAAVAVGISRNKAYKWVACFQAEGVAGLKGQARAPAIQRRRMPSGKPTTLLRTLTPEDHAILLTWQRSQTIAAGRARRAALLLRLAAGESVSHIARQVGLSRRNCYKWARRYQAEGLSGLYDRPRHGQKPTPTPQTALQSA